MIDHRVTDLSYGHLGEVTYDVDSNKWHFSVKPPSPYFRQLLPIRSSIPPSIYNYPSAITASQQRATSTKLLVKSRPEIYPAGPLLLSHIGSQASTHQKPHIGQTLAIGQVVDVEKAFGSRKTTIIATACGEAGHVLRLTIPRVERHEWGRQSSARLSLLDAASPDHGYWVGRGGRILQITCAEDGNTPTTRLAVRQANATTIFRPLYGSNPTPATAPNGYAKTYPPSRINANPIATLTAQRSGSRGHADVTWNPWYSRQFAVVDDDGSWSIWDVEGGVKKDVSARLIVGKSGNIYDGFVPDPALKAPNNADGWHKILWVGTFGMIVVCNRRHLAIFDVKSAPVRIQTKKFFSARNPDWILDSKRSPSNPSHLFILTSSRIFWLEIIPIGEVNGGYAGFRILLSFRHFRDANDNSMRLTTVDGEEGEQIALNLKCSLTKIVSVAIFSEKTFLLNLYSLSLAPDGLSPTASQTSLNLSHNLSDGDSSDWGQLQSLLFLATPLKRIANRPPRPENQYIEEGVKFYQVLAIGSNLGLNSGLCTRHSQASTLSGIIPPTRTYSYALGYMSSKRVTDEPWIILDGHVDDIADAVSYRPHSRKQPVPVWKQKENQRFTMNFKSIFEQAFDRDDNVHFDQSLEELLEHALERIRQAKENEDLAMATFLELSQDPEFKTDLEQGAPVLQAFLTSLERLEEPQALSSLVLSNLTLCPGITFQTFENSSLPDLSNIYDQVAKNWIVSLPLQVPGVTRLAKFNIARRLAIELCLSSIGVSLRNSASMTLSLPAPDSGGLADSFHEPAATPREGSLPSHSIQIPPNSLPDSGFGLPTPERTPSIYSQSHASGSAFAEDPAITRLRQYAVSITSKSDLGTSSLLSRWPAEPGVDPATYSYEATQNSATTEESGEDNTPWRDRQQARRKRRMERFRSRPSTAPTEASSQSQQIFPPFMSQSDASHLGFSAQGVDDMPMSQPNRGVFGSRVAQSKTKARKKKIAGFR